MITARTWELVNYCEQYWHTFKDFPPVATILENLSDYYNTSEEIEADLADEVVLNQFKIRGIDVHIKNSPPENGAGNSSTKRGRIVRKKGLSQEQVAAVHTLLNVADMRSLPKKLEDLGISAATFNGWLKKPEFIAYYKSQAEMMLNDGLPVAHSALVQSAARGNLKAIEFLYKLTGYYTGSESEELMNMKIFIHKLVEIMQTHIDDPNTLKMITSEMLSMLGMGETATTEVMSTPAPPLKLKALED